MEISSFLHTVERWAKQDENIQSLILVGSYARGQARVDSDVDIVVITERPELYINNQSFAEGFGKIFKTKIEDWGRVTSVRVWYESGLEVEFGITTPLWCSKPLDQGTLKVISDGYKVVVDKKNCFKDII